MQLKKRVIAIFAIAAICVGVFFVGKSGMTVPKKESADEKKEQSLFSKDKDTLYLWYTDDALTDYLNSAAVTYNEKYNVRVIPVLKSGAEYLETINDASVADENTPDVYLLTNDALEKAYLAGLATKISGDEVCSISHFPQAALSAVTYNGQYIAYPFYYETSVLLYNQTHLKDYATAQVVAEAAQAQADSETPVEDSTEGTDEGENASSDANVEQLSPELQAQVDERLAGMLPATIEQLENFANSYDAPQQVESVFKWDVVDIFYNYAFAGKYLNVGGESGDDPSSIDIYNLNSIECLKAFQELNQFFYIESKNVEYADIIQDFIDGKIVYTVATTDAVNTIETAKAEGKFAYEYGVASLPNISEELGTRPLSVTMSTVINGYSQKKEIANRFAEFLTCDYGDNLYTKTGKVAASYDVTYDYPALEVYRTVYDTSIPMPKMLETSNFWVQLEIAFTQIWNGDNANDKLKSIAETTMTQITGEETTLEYIEEPVKMEETETGEDDGIAQ